MNKIKFLALGGMDEVGKNLFIIDVDDSIFIMDSGNKNPSFHSFGIDVIIPDFQYLIDNKKKIKGIFLSNGHSRSIGGLSYIIKKMPELPIYATPVTKSAVENEFRKMKVSKFNLKEIEPNGDFKIDDFIIKTFQLTSSQPQCVGFSINNDNKQVVYAVDYVINQNIEKTAYKTDLTHVQNIAESATTKLMITDARRSRESGYGKEGNVGFMKGFKKALKPNEQVLLVGAFSDNIKSTQDMINYAVEQNKKIIIYGRALNEQIKTLKILKLINLPSKNLISFKKLSQEKNCVIFASHNFYQLYRKLSKIANKQDDYVTISKEFDVYVAATPIAGAETFYYKILDDFYKQGIRARSVNKSLAKGMHPFKEDLIKMFTIFKPQNVIPVKGYFRDFIRLEEIAKECGVKDNSTILLDNGEICNVSDSGLKKDKKKVKCIEKFVDGLGVGDVGENIVRERTQMGNNGVIFLGIMIKEKTKELASQITIETVGLSDNQDTLELLAKRVSETVDELLPKNKEDVKKFNLIEAKKTIRKKIYNFSRRKLNKEPTIVPIIIEVR